MFVFSNRSSCVGLIAACAATVGLTIDNPANAADASNRVPATPPSYDWTGFYFGGHAGLNWGSSVATAFDPNPATQRNNYGGLIGGAQFGYNYVMPSRLLVGVEADVSFTNYIASNGVAAKAPGASGTITEQLDFV